MTSTKIPLFRLLPKHSYSPELLLGESAARKENDPEESQPDLGAGDADSEGGWGVREEVEGLAAEVGGEGNGGAEQARACGCRVGVARSQSGPGAGDLGLDVIGRNIDPALNRIGSPVAEDINPLEGFPKFAAEHAHFGGRRLEWVREAGEAEISPEFSHAPGHEIDVAFEFRRAQRIWGWEPLDIKNLPVPNCFPCLFDKLAVGGGRKAGEQGWKLIEEGLFGGNGNIKALRWQNIRKASERTNAFFRRNVGRVRDRVRRPSERVGQRE